MCIRDSRKDDLSLFAQFVQKPDFTVGVIARQHARCVIIVKQFSAKLQDVYKRQILTSGWPVWTEFWYRVASVNEESKE